MGEGDETRLQLVIRIGKLARDIELERRSIEYYTVNDFLTWTSRYEPTIQLPAPYRYSNAGIGLLSYLVATATGKTWEDQVNSEILQPLGMADTTLRPTPEQQKRLAQGHNRAGQDAPRWPVFCSSPPRDSSTTSDCSTC